MPTSRAIIVLILFGSLLFAGFSYIFFDSKIEISKLNELERNFKTNLGINHYRSALREPLNPGLPRFLISEKDRLLEINDSKNILFLIVYKSTVQPDWDDLDSVTKSFLTSSSFDVGHLQWAWSCNINGKSYEGASGFTGDQSNKSEELAKSGWGATATLLTFNDGYFETPWEINVRAETAKQNDFRKLALITTSEKCQKFLSKYQELRFQRRLKGLRLTFEPKEILYSQTFGKNCTEVTTEVFTDFPVITNLISQSETSLTVPINYFGIPSEVLPVNIELPEHWKKTLKSRSGTSVRVRDLLDKSKFTEFVNLRFYTPDKIYQQLSGSSTLIGHLGTPTERTTD